MEANGQRLRVSDVAADGSYIEIEAYTQGFVQTAEGVVIKLYRQGQDTDMKMN